jgi:hypothetical protein
VTSGIASPFEVLILLVSVGRGRLSASVPSSYLGHIYVADKYWYLSGRPELMAQAIARLKHRWGESS